MVFPARAELTHFKKFSFCAPTRAGFPRILKNAVRPSSDAMAPTMRPSLSNRHFPVGQQDQPRQLRRGQLAFSNRACQFVRGDRRLRELRQPATHIVQHVASRCPEGDERNIGDCSVVTVHKKTGLPHLRERLWFPVRRSYRRHRRDWRRSSRKRRRARFVGITASPEDAASSGALATR